MGFRADVLSEGGDPLTISLALTAEPESFVDIFIENPDGQFELEPETTLRVLPADWQDTLRVDISARLDNVVEDNPHSGMLSLYSESTDPDYNLNLTGNDPIIFNIQDVDFAGLEFPIEPLIVEEMAEGGSSFSLSLLSQPAHDVLVSVSLEFVDAFVSFVPESPTLIFSPSNWDVPQSFVVIASEDDIHGNHRTNSLFFSMESGDHSYHSLAVEPVEFDIIDSSPVPGISFDQNSISSITEGEDVSFDFSVKLEGSSVEEILFSIIPDSNFNSHTPLA